MEKVNKVKKNAEAYRNLLNIECYCRSFVANPEFDRTQGQIKLTTLWKEKINLETGERTVLYKYKDFSPDQLKK